MHMKLFFLEYYLLFLTYCKPLQANRNLASVQRLSNTLWMSVLVCENTKVTYRTCHILSRGIDRDTSHYVLYRFRFKRQFDYLIEPQYVSS